VDIIAGSDAGAPGTTHGATLHGELALLVEAGLTPVQALTAATKTPADRFGLKDRGQIKAGLRADLVLVDGDPTSEIKATRAIARIFKNGFEVDRTVPDVAPARAIFAPPQAPAAHQ
jgi:imidazolonepropionase-like amidohydrolase